MSNSDMSKKGNASSIESKPSDCCSEEVSKPEGCDGSGGCSGHGDCSVDDGMERRSFLGTTSGIAMAGGLVAGYGTFFTMAGKYLYPSGDSRSWLMVGPVNEIVPGEPVNYSSPSGEEVVIRRSTEGPKEADKPETEFLALSSVCPHLSCLVHWESQNNRYFCPCHNGVFDADGIATEGPPAAEGQSMKQYELMVENGFLYIKMIAERVGIV